MAFMPPASPEHPGSVNELTARFQSTTFSELLLTQCLPVASLEAGKKAEEWKFVFYFNGRRARTRTLDALIKSPCAL
jgi:hypothetical protein